MQEFMKNQMDAKKKKIGKLLNLRMINLVK